MNPGAENITPDIEARLEAIADRYLDLLNSGEVIDLKEFARQQDEDYELVKTRLVMVEQLFNAAHSSATGDVDELTIHCPNCDTALEIQPGAANTIQCSGCGGEFLLKSDPYQEGVEMIGTSLGRFEIIDILGQGSFGTVYLALDSELRREVTLKVPRSSAYLSPADEERFFREARSAAELKHPAIVRILEVTDVEGLPVIVREYIDGVPLSDYIKPKKLSYNEITDLVITVGEALDHAHQRGVIHRDIKPANILVDRQGQPHVTDFGLAKLVDEREVTMTIEGQVLGTPAYMSPEQAQGHRQLIGPKSDQFSLGVVLFELLAGERPFNGERTVVLQKVVQEEPRTPRSFNPKIPKDLETICLRSMSKTQAKRYESLAEFSEDLRRYREGRPIVARPITRIERGLMWVRRKPMVASLISLVAILLVTVAVGALLNAKKERELRQETVLQISRLHTQAAVEHLLTKDFFNALPHLVESLSIDPSEDSQSEKIKRLQIGLTLLHSPRLLHIWDFDNPLVDVEFSPNGKYVAILESGKQVVIFQVPTGEKVAELPPHSNLIRNFHFHPNSRWILTSSDDRKVRVFDWKKNALVSPAQSFPEPIRFSEFSPDGTLIMSVGSRGTVFITRASRNSKPTILGHRSLIRKAKFFPDSRRVLTLANDGIARIWWAQKAQVLVELPRNSRFQTLDIHPDGSAVLLVARHSFAQAYDSHTGKEIGPKMNCGYGVTRALFSPNGDQVALSGWGVKGGLFNYPDGQLLVELEQGFDHKDTAYSPDGQRLAYVGADRRVRVWNSKTGERIAPLLSHGPYVSNVRFHPNGHLLLTVSTDGLLSLWDLSRQQPRLPRGRQGTWINAMAVHEKENKVVVGTRNGRVRIWDMDSMIKPDGRTFHRGLVFLDVHHGRQLAVSLGNDHWAKIWRLKNLWVEHNIKMNSISYTVRFSPDGKYLAIGEEIGNLRILNVSTGKDIYPPLKVGIQPRAFKFSSDGIYFATGGLNSPIQVFETRTGKAIGPKISAEAANFDLALSRNADVLVLLNAKSARVINPRTGKENYTLNSRKSECRIIQFSPDERTFLTADQAGFARLWDTQTGQAVTQPMVTHGAYFSAAFSVDGTQLALGSSDGTAKIYSTQSGELIFPSFRHSERVSALQFIHNDSKLVSSSHDGYISIWDLESIQGATEELIWYSKALTGRHVHPIRGAIEQLSREKILEAWEESRRRTPHFFKLNKKDVIAWHKSELFDAYYERNIGARVYHLDRLIQYEPFHWRHYDMRGNAHLKANNILTSIPDGVRSVSLKVFDLLTRATVGLRFPEAYFNEFFGKEL